jgi:hypothetical protein
MFLGQRIIWQDSHAYAEHVYNNTRKSASQKAGAKATMAGPIAPAHRTVQRWRAYEETQISEELNSKLYKLKLHSAFLPG